MTMMLIEQVMMMANAIIPDGPGKQSEIDALARRVNDLTAAFDFWNRWMLWGLAFAALAAIWVGLTTRLTIVRSKQLAVAQGSLDTEKEGQLTLALKDKDRQIAEVKAESDSKSGLAEQHAGEANERAGRANKSAGIANEAAANANAKAQQLALETESLKRENLQTQANLEAERQTRLEMEKVLAPRKVMGKMYEDGTDNAEDFKKLGKKKVLLEYVPDFEAWKAACDLEFFFKLADWSVTFRQSQLPIGDGVTVMQLAVHANSGEPPQHEWASGEVADVVTGWLLNNEWQASLRPIDREFLGDNDVAVVVGRKPNTLSEQPMVKEANKQTAARYSQFAPNANRQDVKVLFFTETRGNQMPDIPKK